MMNKNSSLPCFLLAAGRGERMRPLTDNLPKPLLTIQNKSLLAWHLEGIAKSDIQKVVINHAWLGEKIEKSLGDGRQFGLDIEYSPEGTALETAGGIRKALPLLCPEDYFLVINGDVFTGDESLVALTKIKTKNELIGEVLGLLQSPAKRVLAALLHHHEKQADATPAEA